MFKIGDKVKVYKPSRSKIFIPFDGEIGIIDAIVNPFGFHIYVVKFPNPVQGSEDYYPACGYIESSLQLVESEEQAIL